jgi:hypothetical protein
VDASPAHREAAAPAAPPAWQMEEAPRRRSPRRSPPRSLPRRRGSTPTRLRERADVRAEPEHDIQGAAVEEVAAEPAHEAAELFAQPELVGGAAARGLRRSRRSPPRRCPRNATWEAPTAEHGLPASESAHTATSSALRRRRSNPSDGHRAHTAATCCRRDARGGRRRRTSSEDRTARLQQRPAPAPRSSAGRAASSAAAGARRDPWTGGARPARLFPAAVGRGYDRGAGRLPTSRVPVGPSGAVRPRRASYRQQTEEHSGLHEEARRLARLLVSEIKLYNEEQIEEGPPPPRHLPTLAENIDRSRQMYEERVDARVRDESTTSSRRCEHPRRRRRRGARHVGRRIAGQPLSWLSGGLRKTCSEGMHHRRAMV